jgi:hypothetical protein
MVAFLFLNVYKFLVPNLYPCLGPNLVPKAGPKLCQPQNGLPFSGNRSGPDFAAPKSDICIVWRQPDLTTGLILAPRPREAQGRLAVS